MAPETRFQPRLQILPPAQRRLWDELGAVPPGFVLYGGTAIALHLGHRHSIGFDLVSREAFQPQHLIEQMPLLAEGTVVQQAPSTLGIRLDRWGPVRLSFFGVPRLRRLRAPHLAANGLRIAALLDLAGTKAAVVQQRAEAKDYIDIDAMLTNGLIDLPTALAAAGAIYGPQFNPLPTLKALTWFEDGDLPSLPRAKKRRLVRAAGAVDVARLPVVSPDADAG